MPYSRAEKADMVERYSGGIASASHAFLVDFKGLTVAQATDLRTRIRDQGGSYEVVKNRLALRAVEGTGLEGLSDHFRGPTAVAYIEDDPVALAKALTEFQKDVPAIEFKGGVVDGQAIDASQVEAISKMPGREELIAKLLFLLSSPVTGLARGLAAITRQLVVVLDQVGQSKDQS